MPFHFDKDYSVLSSGIDVNLSEDIDTLKQLVGEGKATPATIRDRIPRWRNRTTEELQSILDYQKKEKLKTFIQQYTNLIFSKYCIVKEELPFEKQLDKSGARIRNLGTQEKVIVIEGSLVIPRSQIYKEGPVLSTLQSWR